MGLIKQIFGIITTVIKLAILFAIILYPIFVLKVNPINFYWDKIQLLWEAIKEFPFREVIDSIKRGGILRGGN